jgi:hypothetical protein
MTVRRIDVSLLYVKARATFYCCKALPSYVALLPEARLAPNGKG